MDSFPTNGSLFHVLMRQVSKVSFLELCDDRDDGNKEA